jgi:hypothetical protein
MKKLLSTFALVIGLGVIGAIAQYWPSLPIVGGGSYCSAYGNGNVCTQTVPAGPAMTGNETVPADTNLTQGQYPSSVKINVTSLGGGAIAIVDGDATTYTVAPGVSTVILTDSNTITSSAITTPAAPVDGQYLRISSTQTVTTFSLTANSGQSLGSTTPSVITASTTVAYGYEWIYRKSNATWYRVR